MDVIISRIGNGWILSLMVLAVSYIPMLFGGKAAKRLVDYSFASTKGKAFSVIMSILFIPLIVYPVFLKIQIGSIQFYIGIVLLVVGAVAAITSFINYFSTPLDEPINKGMYRISRNPIYISFSLMVVGMALMLHSAIIGGLIVLNFVLQHFIRREGLIPRSSATQSSIMKSCICVGYETRPSKSIPCRTNHTPSRFSGSLRRGC
ncbi:MAG: methyltransferase [Spirochaetales bacterium]|nr:methyltransferase [Spirochaetales bacterium]